VRTRCRRFFFLSIYIQNLYIYIDLRLQVWGCGAAGCLFCLSVYRIYVSISIHVYRCEDVVSQVVWGNPNYTSWVRFPFLYFLRWAQTQAAARSLFGFVFTTLSFSQHLRNYSYPTLALDELSLFLVVSRCWGIGPPSGIPHLGRCFFVGRLTSSPANIRPRVPYPASLYCLIPSVSIRRLAPRWTTSRLTAANICKNYVYIMYIDIHIYIYIYIYIYVWVYKCEDSVLQVFLYIYMCVCVYLYTYRALYIYVYIYIELTLPLLVYP